MSRSLTQLARCSVLYSIFLLLTCSLNAQSYADWTRIGKSAVKRSEATAIAYEDQFYIFNGFSAEIKMYDRVMRYDPATNTYTRLASMPVVNGKSVGVTHNGIALVGDKIWIVGGRIGDHPGRVTDAVWLYDISEDRWSRGPTLPARRGGGGVGRLGNRLHYVGGFDENAECDVADHFVYDLNEPNKGWQDLTRSAPMPEARNHFATVVIDGKLYTVGGQNGHDGCGNGIDNGLVHAYDPVTNSWQQRASMPKKQSHAEPSTFAFNGRILSVGGAESGGDGVWSYDPGANKWTVVDQMRLPRALLAPVARIYKNNLFVLNGGSFWVGLPRDETLVKSYAYNDNRKLSFNQGKWAPAIDGQGSRSRRIILSNLNGEEDVNYNISLSGLPSWLTVERAGGKARESFAEIKLIADSKGLANGTYKHRLTATAPSYQSTGIDIELTVTGGSTSPPSTGPVSVWLEAECGAIGSRWQSVSGSGAANGQWVEAAPGFNSLSSAPTSKSRNLARYRFSIDRSEDFTFFARVDAPSGNDDSFWVRINGGGWIKWWQGLRTSNGFDWRQVTGSPFQLKAGENVIDFAFREDGTRLDKLYFTNGTSKPSGSGGNASGCGQNPPPVANEALYIEVECAESIAGDWRQISHSGASGGSFLTYAGARRATPPGTYGGREQLTYNFSLSASGTYRMHLRMDVRTTSYNSIWVSIDDGRWIEFSRAIGGAELLTSGFEWREVADKGQTVNLQLGAGKHKVRLAAREAFTDVDRLYIGPAGENPTRAMVADAPCREKVEAFADNVGRLIANSKRNTTGTELSIFPNPARGYLNFKVSGMQGETTLDVQLFDMTGKLVKRRNYVAAGETIADKVALDRLPMGTYLLRVVAEGFSSEQRFVKVK